MAKSTELSDPKSRKKLGWKRWLLIVASIPVGVILLFLVLNQLTPWPVTSFTKAAFSGFGNGTHYPRVSNFSELEGKVAQYDNLEYDGQLSNSGLDVIVPKAESEVKKPVIFWVHGGAFVGGDKADVRDYCVMLASQGYVVVNINYGLAPEVKYPTPVIQIGKAYDYIKNRQADYPVDLSRVIFGGDSAGAQLALQFVNIQVNDAYQKHVNIERTVPKDSIKGAVSLSGLLDLKRFDESGNPLIDTMFSRAGWSYFGRKAWQPTQAAQQANIIGNIDSNFPTLFITDGNTGSFEDQAKDLTKELTGKGIKVTSKFYAKSDTSILGHEFQFAMNTPQSQEIYDSLTKFLAEVSQ